MATVGMGQLGSLKPCYLAPAIVGVGSRGGVIFTRPELEETPASPTHHVQYIRNLYDCTTWNRGGDG